jgi:hypothetical protein
MADDNKPLKYMRYAIGEIVLVVIGILIALQINNWNERRKEKVLEREYLIKLRKEVIFNIENSKRLLRYHDFLLGNSKLIIESIAADTVSNTESLTVAIEHVGWSLSLGYIRNVWNELHNTGNIRLIRNDSLHNDFTSLFESIDLLNSEVNECNTFHLGFRKLAGEVLSPELRLSIHENLTPWKYKGALDDLPSHVEIVTELKRIKGVKGYLVDITEGRMSTKSMVKSILNRLDELMINLNNELDKS